MWRNLGHLTESDADERDGTFDSDGVETFNPSFRGGGGGAGGHPRRRPGGRAPAPASFDTDDDEDEYDDDEDEYDDDDDFAAAAGLGRMSAAERVRALRASGAARKPRKPTSAYTMSKAAARTTAGSAGAVSAMHAVLVEELKVLESDHAANVSRLEEEFADAKKKLLHATHRSEQVLHATLKRQRKQRRETDVELEALEAEVEGVRALKREVTAFVTRSRAAVATAQRKFEEEKRSQTEDVRLREERVKQGLEMLEEEKLALAEAQAALNDAASAMEREKQAANLEIGGQRESLSRGRAKALDADVAEFERYRLDAEAYIDAKRALLAAEKQSYDAERGEAEARLAEQMGQLEAEVTRTNELREGKESGKSQVEYDWVARSGYVEMHRQKVQEDRAEFEKTRVELEEALERERQALIDRMRRVEAKEREGLSAVTAEEQRFAQERQHAQRELEARRTQLDRSRMKETEAQLMAQQHAALTRGSPGSTAAPPPLPPSPGFANPPRSTLNQPAPTPSSAGRPPGATVIPVYVGEQSQRNFLGEVTVPPGAPIGAVRRAVRAAFRLPPEFQLRKGNNTPIPVAQDSTPANALLTSNADALVVIT